jgi:dolichol-phosphate mannosyltransferase
MISIVIPTKNEASNLPEVLKLIHSQKLKDYKIIIVDDNSQDGTPELLKRLQKKYPLITIIRKNKTGYGSAIKDGFEKALSLKSDIILTMDSDLSHNPKNLKTLAEKIRQGSDIAIGSRYIPQGGIKNWSILRRLISKTANVFLKISLSTEINDNTSGYRAYSSNLLKKILPKLKSNNYTILEEILYISKSLGSRISEVPIIFKDRTKGASKARILKEASNLFKLIFKLRKHSIAKFSKFCLVGLSGILVNQGLLWFLTEKAQIFYIYSSLIAIESSILTNFVLNDIWTFKNSRNSSFLSRLLKFNLARFFTLLINLGILWVLTTLGINYLISNLIGIVLATVLAYSISSGWVWKK